MATIIPKYKGTKHFGDSDIDGGIDWAVFDPCYSFKQIREHFCAPEYCGGIGRPFTRKAYIQRTRTRVLVTQMWGWDV